MIKVKFDWTIRFFFASNIKYKEKMNSSISTWTDEQDLFLLDLIKEHGVRKWSKIAKIFNAKFPDRDKTGKQCRERWLNHLDPELVKETFTMEDEIKVFEYQKKLGNRWSDIAVFFEGRNDNFIKNCFYSAVRRNLRKYNRDKVPSKQLKGTINKLLSNSKTRKILMDFPEHEVPIVAQEKNNSESAQTKFEIAVPRVVKKSPEAERKVKFAKINLLEIEEPDFKYFDIHDDSTQPFSKPFLQVNYQKDLNDITPRLFHHMGTISAEDLEIITNISSKRPSFDSKRTSIDSNRLGSTKSEISEKFSFRIPEFSPKGTLQYYPTPRSSK